MQEGRRGCEGKEAENGSNEITLNIRSVDLMGRIPKIYLGSTMTARLAKPTRQPKDHPAQPGSPGY